MNTFRFSGFCTRLKKAVKEWDNEKLYISKISGLGEPLRVEIIFHETDKLVYHESHGYSQENIDDLVPLIKNYLKTGSFLGKLEEIS